MKNLLAAFTGLGLLCLAETVAAQLPANPWAPHPNDGDFGDNVIHQGPAVAPNAPMYENNSSGGEIMPVDPWARARDKTNTLTWRGSGRHDRDLNYVGEATTYGTAMGQEMIAPEVNRHNMLVMLEHLRSMGYKIPDSYDQNIKDMPRNYARYLRDSYDAIGASDMKTDPLGNITKSLMDNFEDGTGLDIENLLFNSIDILATD